MGDLILDDGLRLHYQIDGSAAMPPLVFANSLGTTMRMWDAQVAALGSAFWVVRYDTRGHGASGVPNEPATITRLGRDLLALLDHLAIAQAHVCGLSLGGITAQWLAAHHPNRVNSLVLANTAARIGSAEGWEARIAAVSHGGMAAVGEAVLARFFSPAFRASNSALVATYGATLAATNPQGYCACCAALGSADLRPLLEHITAPTLIIAGTYDEATPPAQSEELHTAILKSELVLLAAGHLSNVEQPDAFSAYLNHFLATKTCQVATRGEVKARNMRRVAT
jgi:3-oxoadipate enol-lactonase